MLMCIDTDKGCHMKVQHVQPSCSDLHWSCSLARVSSALCVFHIERLVCLDYTKNLGKIKEKKKQKKRSPEKESGKLAPG